MKVWVTRSEPGATRLSDYLAQSGYEVVCKPVLSIEALIPQLTPFNLVTDIIFLSEHAVSPGLDYLRLMGIDRSQITVFAVGPTTAKKLHQYGIVPFLPTINSSEGLLASSELSAGLNRNILILAGEGGRGLLESELARRGANVMKIPLYRRKKVALSKFESAIKPIDIDAIIVGSGEGLHLMASIWLSFSGKLEVPVVVPSERIARLAKGLNFLSIVTSLGLEPDEVLQALKAFE